MKKINRNGLFVICVVAAALLLHYGYNTEKEPKDNALSGMDAQPHPAADLAKQEAEKQEQINKMRDEIAKLYSGFRRNLHYGIWGDDKKPCVKIGRGVPISLEELKVLLSDKKFFSDEKAQEAETFYNSVTKDNMECKELSIPDVVIGRHEANFIEKRIEEKYRPVCMQHGIKWDELTPELKASIFCIDMATGGRIESYKNFLDAVAQKNWKMAGAQAYVDAKSVFLVKNPTVQDFVPTFFNKNMKGLFDRIHEEELKKQQKVLIQQNQMLMLIQTH